MEIQSLFAGERLDMTALDDADAAVIARWYDNPEFAHRFEATPARPHTATEIGIRIAVARDSQSDYLFGFRLRESGALVGWGGLDGVEWRSRVASLAVALAPEQWGRGLGGDAVRLILGYAFGELELYRVQLTVFADNLPALRLYERAGFQHEGVHREFLLRDGQRVDMLLMGMLAREWREAHGPQVGGQGANAR